MAGADRQEAHLRAWWKVVVTPNNLRSPERRLSEAERTICPHFVLAC